QRLAKVLNLHASTVPIGVNNLIKCIVDLQKKLMIPTTLKEQGSDLNLLNEVKEEIITAAMKDICTATNPREATREDLLKILDKVSGSK
ncbi:iron-containing alcohol dehydrogenase, partial [Clostridium perfringens]